MYKNVISMYRKTHLSFKLDPDFIWVPCHSDHLFGVLDSNGRRSPQAANMLDKTINNRDVNSKRMEI